MANEARKGSQLSHHAFPSLHTVRRPAPCTPICFGSEYTTVVMRMLYQVGRTLYTYAFGFKANLISGLFT